MSAKLSDEQVFDALHAALLALGRGEGETVRGNTTMQAARRALTLLQMGLLLAQENAADKNPAIKDPAALSGPPPSR